MNREEAERILSALKSGTPLVSRHKAAEALEWALKVVATVLLPERMSKLAMDMERPDAEFQRILHDNLTTLYVDDAKPLPAGPGSSDE